MQLTNGTLLQGGKYRIERDLGQGGFGITYLARETSSQRQVAIKEYFFKQYCGRDVTTSHVYVPIADNTRLVEKFGAKFRKEALTLLNLNHPNIIKVFDTFDENGTSYYVMEYVQGGSLKKMIETRGRIPEYEAIGYLRKVGSALEYIHSKSIMHLDIKPDNIMIGDNGKVTVIDFGVSKLYDADSGNGLTATTPVGMSKGYSPFEQTYDGGVSSFSPQSDVYALAATLYKLLTGVTPPPSPDVKDHGLPRNPLQENNVSSNVIAAIVNAMKTRGLRTQSVKEFIRQLDDDSTIVIEDEETIVNGGNEKQTEVKKNFTYPLAIQINKKIYTDCQLWTIHEIHLHKDRTVVKITVQSYDEPTYAWSTGSEKIVTGIGRTIYQKYSSLPRESGKCIIEPWKIQDVSDIYPPIPNDVACFDLIDRDNDDFSVRGISISNGKVSVPGAYSENFVGITKDQYFEKRRKGYTSGETSPSKDSDISIPGLIYIIAIIGSIIFIIKSFIS